MIGLMLFNAAALLYAAAYVVHSVRRNRSIGAVVTSFAAVCLVLLCAGLVWVLR